MRLRIDFLTQRTQSFMSYTEKDYNLLSHKIISYFNVMLLKDSIRRKINGNLDSV